MNSKQWTSCMMALILIAGMFGLPGSRTNVASADPVTFTHPGILQTAADIQNMKSRVTAQAEPWYSTYTNLADTVTSYGTISANDYNLSNLKRSNSGSYNEMRLAANKVYNLALMYTVTGNSTYAEGARTIMLKYASIFEGVGTYGDTNSVYDTNLDVGVVALKFTAAAELLRYDYAGWSSADTNALIAMFHKNESGTAVSMYQLLANDAALAAYDMDNITHGHAAILRLGSMAYAIFAEDAYLYNLVKSDFTANSTAYFTNQNSAAWQKKPDKSLGANGYSLLYNYNASTGQSKESDRDQQHAMVNLSSFIAVAHMAWNQGDSSLYEFNNRTLLKAVDFSARYNLGYDMAAYTSAYPWNHHSNLGITTFDRGRVTESTFSLAYNYYKFSSSAVASEYAYLSEMINHPLYAIDRNSFDVPGFSALTASPAARASDYTTNVTTLNNTVHWQYSGVTRMVNGTYPLYGEYATALVNDAVRNGSNVQLKGTHAIAVLPFTSFNAVTRANLRYASIGAGTIEIRTASSSGTLFGQPEAYSAGGATNGDRGTLLATIPVSSTGGLGTFQMTNFSGNMLTNTGSTGGSVTGNYMIVVVFKGADTNSTLQLNELKFQ